MEIVTISNVDSPVYRNVEIPTEGSKSGKLVVEVKVRGKTYQFLNAIEPSNVQPAWDIQTGEVVDLVFID